MLVEVRNKEEVLKVNVDCISCFLWKKNMSGCKYEEICVEEGLRREYGIDFSKLRLKVEVKEKKEKKFRGLDISNVKKIEMRF